VTPEPPLEFGDIALYPTPHRRVIGGPAALPKGSSTSRKDNKYRRYQRTAQRMTVGSVCRHLKIVGRIATGPFSVPANGSAKLQHYPLFRLLDSHRMPRLSGHAADARCSNRYSDRRNACFTRCVTRRDTNALIAASRSGSADAVALLLKAGADVTRPWGVNDWTPLEHAVHKRKAGSVKALLDAGAPVDQRDAHQRTALR
jgi:hypothetical protein